ncbi:MAG: RluA family pseudouridine synthase [Planctomycetaceae bacterium]|nr:RluA family pseudouridine synthase [Planctomycetaceae bacterium]
MEESRPAERREFAIGPDLAGERLDQALARLLPERSRAYVKKLLDAGRVTLCGKPAKPALKVREGDAVVVDIPEATPLQATPEDIPLDVLYEDNDIIVLNKRPGIVAHPSQGHRDGTLVNALLHHYGDSLSEIGGVLRPGIVHRLDRDTSGCLVAAKNDAAHAALMQQFMERDVEKIYLAITDGIPRPVEGKVEGNIGRRANDRKRHGMLPRGGRHSLTFYRTLENYGLVALVECRLLTGRTHQARVHLAHQGAPVLCDKDYGRREVFTERELRRAVEVFRSGASALPSGPAGAVVLDRQALHAWKLSFAHPKGGQLLSFEAPIPPDMLAVLAPLREAWGAMK